MYYRLSESLVKRIIRFPQRIEEGIAPKTVAVMQSQTRLKKIRGISKKVTEEIWVMYQEIGVSGESLATSKSKQKLDARHYTLATPKKRIISAWRYPGQSPIGKKIQIPDDILQELEALIS